MGVFSGIIHNFNNTPIRYLVSISMSWLVRESLLVSCPDQGCTILIWKVSKSKFAHFWSWYFEIHCALKVYRHLEFDILLTRNVWSLSLLTWHIARSNRPSSVVSNKIESSGWLCSNPVRDFQFLHDREAAVVERFDDSQVEFFLPETIDEFVSCEEFWKSSNIWQKRGDG